MEIFLDICPYLVIDREPHGVIFTGTPTIHIIWHPCSPCFYRWKMIALIFAVNVTTPGTGFGP
jgi:hypothetical protein